MTTERVINIFLEQGPRRLWFNPKSSAVNSNGGNNIPYSIFYSIIILINFLLGLRFPTLVQNLLKDYVDKNSKLFEFQMVVNKWNSLPDNVKSHQLFNLFKNNLDNFLSET